MKKSISKKIIAIMMTVLMLVSLAPTTFAEDATFTVTTPETIEYGKEIKVDVIAPVGTSLDFYLDDVLVETVASTTDATTTKNISTAKLGTLCVDVVATFEDGTSETISKNVKVIDYLKNETTYIDWDFNTATKSTKIETSSFGGLFKMALFNAYGSSRISKNYVETVLNDSTNNNNFASGTTGAKEDKAIPLIVKPKAADTNTYPIDDDSGIGHILITNNSKTDYKKIHKTGCTMVFEYDLMLPKVSDYTIDMGVYNNYSCIIKTGGEVHGTKEILSDGQWAHIKAVVKYPADGNNGDLYVYVNDKLSRTKPKAIPNYDYKQSNDEIKICFNKNTAWGNDEVGKETTVFAVDNMKQYVYAMTPTYEFNKTVSVNSDAVSISFDGLKFVDSTITDETVSLHVDGKKVNADLSYDSAANKITLTLLAHNSLKAFSKGKILISKGAKIQTPADGRKSSSSTDTKFYYLLDIELPLNRDMEINFVISDENNRYYEVTKEGNKATYKVINENDNNFNVKTILAGYDDKCLSKLWFSEASIEKGGKSIWTRELTGVGSTKAMFWTTDNAPLIPVK